MRIGEILVREGQLTPQQLAGALRAQELLGDRLGTTLLEQGLISEDTLLKALGRQRSTRTVSSSELTGVSPEVVRMIPARLAERYGVVPFHLKGRTLSVASRDPVDLLKEDEIGFLTSCMVRTCIALDLRIHEALERYYRIGCPPRLQALVRRLALRPVQARPVQARPGDAGVAPTAPARPVQAQRPVQARPVQARPGNAGVAPLVQARSAKARSGDAGVAPTVQARSAKVPPAPPLFIELDEEDAALLGTSSPDSSKLTPEPDQPVILERAPLPWLTRDAAGGEPVPSRSRPTEPAPGVVEQPAAVAEVPATAESAPEPHGDELQPRGASTTPSEQSTGDTSLEERLSRAAARLGDVEIRDDIGDVLLAFCQPYFRRRVVLVARKGYIVGWRGEGEGIEGDRVRTIEIPDHDPSVFLGVTGAGGFWLGALPTLDANRTLADGLGGTFPRECVVLPVILRSRVVCYLYGDNLESGVAGAPVAELRRLVAKAGLAFEVYILKNKLRML